jgi:hypothetical protein
MGESALVDAFTTDLQRGHFCNDDEHQGVPIYGFEQRPDTLSTLHPKDCIL